jgi:protocatechuate 3,4-dioxygenase beta subunit
MLAWAAVVVGWLLAFGWAQARAAWLLGRARADGPAPVDLDELRRRAGVRQRVGLLVTPLVSSPAVWGLVRARVLLPPGLAEELSPRQLQWVLLHELAHIRRGDLWVALFQRVLQAVYFFNPAVWVANRLIDQQREFACDDAALAASALPRRECGAVFLTLVERADTGPALAAPGLGLFGYKAFVKRRLLRILDGRPPLRERLSLGALALLLALAVALLPCVQAEDRQAAPAAPPADTPRTAAPDEGAPVVYAGRVLDPDGRALAGARVFHVQLGRDGFKHQKRATTGPDGRFRFVVPRAEFDRARETEPWKFALVAATARGYGPAWESAGRAAEATNLTMTLAPDDVPIKGRVVDLEGRPIQGVTIAVGTLYCRSDANGKPLPFDAPSKPGERGTIMSPEEMVRSPTTDSDGRFTLTGVGRDRLLEIGFIGPTIEHRWVEVMTRPGPSQVLPGTGIVLPGNKPTKVRFGNTFVHVAAPTKPIVGVVRDADTGKPLAHISLYKPFTRSDEPSGSATTDAEGRYRLVGLGKCDAVELKAYPEGDQPYYAKTFKVRMNTPGLEPVTADITLKRRLVLSGRVTDRATGKPVGGVWVTYRPLTSNPHVARAPGDVETSAGSDDNGAFRIPAMTGKGVVLVRARRERSNRYLSARLDPADRARGLLDLRDPSLLDTAPRPTMPEEYNAYRLVEVPEKATSFSCDLTLDPGRTLAGKVVDPDGKPLAGATVFSPNDPDVGGYHETLEGADFTVFALDLSRPRRLYFEHERRRLGASLVVRGDEAGPVTARLEPLGAVHGRLVDARGKPIAGAAFQKVYADADGRPRVQFPAGLPYLTPEEEKRAERARGYSGKTLITGPEKSDADGRFRIPSLLPGVKFDLRAHVSVPAPDIAPNASRVIGDRVIARPTVRPGEDLDLGELRITLSKKEGKPGR